MILVYYHFPPNQHFLRYIPYFLFRTQKMIKKEVILKTLEEFPENIQVEELIERLILLQKIEAGEQQSKEGNVVKEEEAVYRLKKWLK